MKNRYFHTLLLLAMLLPFCLQAQMEKLLLNVPAMVNEEDQWVVNLTPNEKMELLAKLLPNDSVQFRDYEEKFWPLDTLGLRFIDLDGDQDLDLLYSGRSGNMTLRDSKVYINDNKKLTFAQQLWGTVTNIQKKNGQIIVHTGWIPCCGSYTARIGKFVFSTSQIAEVEYSILVIGRSGIMFNMPDFDQLEKGRVEQVKLAAFPSDLRGMSPYFRKKDKEIKPKLRLNDPIELLVIDKPTDVSIIDTKEFNKEQWYLVITTPLENIPTSLYEWTQRGKHPRRFVGWTKDVQLK